MKQLKIIRNYTDTKLDRKVLKDELITVTDERAAQILAVRYGIVVADLPNPVKKSKSKSKKKAVAKKN